MTEVKKLRALLAEARREHDGDANIGACGTDNDGNDTRCDRCQRIDAALAEPVETPPALALLRKMKRERDEARAEVRRTYKELSESIAREAEAYERGAEAMREAAASCVGSDTALLQTYRSVLEGRIRDLPVPEDEP